MDFGLKTEVIDRINGVFRKYPEIEEVILYGSRAKGEQKKVSDIDLTLKGESLTESILSMVRSDLDDLLLPYMIDISLLGNISNPDLIDHISRIGREFYKKQSA